MRFNDRTKYHNEIVDHIKTVLTNDGIAWIEQEKTLTENEVFADNRAVGSWPSQSA